jgi:hypothetical protein
MEGVPIMARLRINDDEPIPYVLTDKALKALAADQAAQDSNSNQSGKSYPPHQQSRPAGSRPGLFIYI